MIRSWIALTVYYAHCIAIYSTPQENRDIETLESLGFKVVNPNSPEVNAACSRIRAEVEAHNTNRVLCTGDLDPADADCYGKPQHFHPKDPGAEVMKYFKPLAQGCDVLAFRALPDGRIPAGVAKEIEWAAEIGIPIIELPSSLKGRQLSVELTREYLREVGTR